jgi:hypothetical protein
MAVFELLQVKVAPAGELENVVRGTLAPLQTVMFAGTAATGVGLTVTAAISVLLQPLVVPVTV